MKEETKQRAAFWNWLKSLKDKAIKALETAKVYNILTRGVKLGKSGKHSGKRRKEQKRSGVYGRGVAPYNFGGDMTAHRHSYARRAHRGVGRIGMKARQAYSAKVDMIVAEKSK